MALMGRELVKSSNIDLASLRYRDIYSCFPIAVSVVARELGMDPSDGTKLTLTGGLPYHGGPGSNYSMHGLVALTHKLRDDRGSFGLITANGGFLSKHAAGVYSTTRYSVTHPNATRWSRVHPSVYQAELDAAPEAEVDDRPSGKGMVETYTVVHNNRGEYRAIVVGRLLSSGARFVSISNDVELMKRMKSEDFLHRIVDVSTDKKGVGRFFSLPNSKL